MAFTDNTVSHLRNEVLFKFSQFFFQIVILLSWVKNKFVDHPGFNPSVWKMEWESAGEEEKERYAKMARGMAEDGGSALADDPSSQRKTIRTLLKQLEWTVNSLYIIFYMIKMVFLHVNVT